MQLAQIVERLNSLLRVGEVADSSLNGLQVETGRDVTRIAMGVDATLETFEGAREAGAQLVIAHHGLIWDKVAITGALYRRVRYLIENEMGLYAAHLPLDMHPEVGNNAELARMIGLKNAKPFLQYKGSLIGLVGDVDEMSVSEIAATLEHRLQNKVIAFDYGRRDIRRIAVCSGGGGSDLAQAIGEGADAYLTGEVSHQAATLAQDAGVSLIFAGHYATETLGLKALALYIEEAFGIPTTFISRPTGL